MDARNLEQVAIELAPRALELALEELGARDETHSVVRTYSAWLLGLLNGTKDAVYSAKRGHLFLDGTPRKKPSGVKKD